MKPSGLVVNAPRTPMRHRPEYACHLHEAGKALATALVNYADGDYEEFKRMCQGVWPHCDFYRGGTHLRVLIEGTSNGASFYVETI
jgi:hypothetical protein